jgi:hypothetical protein
MAQDGGEVVVAARVPPEWADRIDEEATKLGAQMGTRFDRADILRMALSRYLGLVPDQEKGDQQTAAT